MLATIPAPSIVLAGLLAVSACGGDNPTAHGPDVPELVPSPASSVMPQSSSSGAPVLVSQASIVDNAIVCPPTVLRVMLDSEADSRSGWLSIIEYMAGTPSNIVAM